MLITVDEVIASMGLASHLKTDLSDTITSTIKKAQNKLGADLGCSIEQFSCIDVVHLNSDLYSGVVPHGMLKVKLANLFVSPSSVRATYADAVGGVSTKVKPVLVDGEQGTVYFPLDLDNKYLTIVYESGIDPKEVPDTIRQALLVYTALIFAENQPDKSAPAPAPGVNELALAMAASYRKVSDFSFRPFVHSQAAL